MSDIVDQLGTKTRTHVVDNLGKPPKASSKSLNISVSAEAELIAEIDAAVAVINEKLPAMAQINRARFLRGCVLVGLADLEQLMIR